MSDNTTLNAGSAGDVMRTVDKSSVKTQVVALDAGGSGAESLVSGANPLPTAGATLKATGTITAAGQSVSISDLKGCGTVQIATVPTSVSSQTLVVEVQTSSGVWQPGKFVYATGTSGSVVSPNANPATNGVFTAGSSSIRALVDVAGYEAVRLRASAFTGTSLAVTLTASQGPTGRIAPDAYPVIPQANIVQLGGQALPQPGTGAGVAAIPVLQAAGYAETNELSAFVSSSGNTLGSQDPIGGAASFMFVNNGGSGSPFVDLVLQESYDSGNSYFDIYHFERVTGTTYNPAAAMTPPIQLLGMRRRWVWTFSGSGNMSVGIKMVRGGSAAFNVYRQFFSRDANLLAGNASAVSAAFNVGGCKQLTASVTVASATSPASYVIQGSMDGTNWYDMCTAVAAVAGATVALASDAGKLARFACVAVSSAGTGQTGTVVGLVGVG